MMDNLIVNALWIGNSLQPLELLTIRSFQHHGHQVVLWAYDDIGNVPTGTEVADANKILGRDQLFSYKYTSAYGLGKGSYAGFSDIFRYKLLYEMGGIYVDMDVTCLKEFDFPGEYLFRYHHQFGAVGNIMKCPAGAPVMDWCYRQAVKYVKAENRNWELPIRILNEGISEFSMEDRVTAISNNDRWPVVARMMSRSRIVPQDWYAIHWMNEEWRRLRLDKAFTLPGSVLDDQYRLYDIDVERLTGTAQLGYRVRLSRLYYIAAVLGSRILK